MQNSSDSIRNLLAEYTHRFDRGELEAAAKLFVHADILMGASGVITHEELLKNWRENIIIYPDGTPKTKHASSSLIINVDEPAGLAEAQSYYVVYQQTPSLPLQVIASGCYHDKFSRLDGGWAFTERDYGKLDLLGDLTHHLRNAEQITAMLANS